MLTDEEIIAAADAAGLERVMRLHGGGSVCIPNAVIVMFARAIAEKAAAEEREANARLCEAACPAGGRAWSAEQAACFEALQHVAAAIRKRGEPKA